TAVGANAKSSWQVAPGARFNPWQFCEPPNKPVIGAPPARFSFNVTGLTFRTVIFSSGASRLIWVSPKLTPVRLTAKAGGFPFPCNATWKGMPLIEKSDASVSGPALVGVNWNVSEQLPPGASVAPPQFCVPPNLPVTGAPPAIDVMVSDAPLTFS